VKLLKGKLRKSVAIDSNFSPKNQTMKNESLHTLSCSGRSPGFPKLLLIVFLALSLTAAHAQTLIKGKVTDENSTGMPGVNILVKGTTTEQLQIPMETIP
jgi:hypothetical protein